MNNKNEIKKECLRLILKLNRSNKIRNQQTELIFQIKTIQNTDFLMATVNNEKYLKIGTLVNPTSLLVDSNFEFYNFADYLKKSLTTFDGVSDINIFIRKAILRLYNYDVG